MKVFVLGALTLLAVFMQVTVAPLFPVSGATFEFPLALLVMVAAFGGPLAAMVTTPVTAILLGFVSSRAPGLLLLGFLPVVPVAYLLETRKAPFTDYLQTMMTGVGTGVWLRGLLASAIMVTGAGFSFAVITRVILPGLFLDFALLSAAYVVLRLVGYNKRTLILPETGFLAHE